MKLVEELRKRDHEPTYEEKRAEEDEEKRVAALKRMYCGGTQLIEIRMLLPVPTNQEEK